MKHTDYIYEDTWFAWHPVRLTTKKWIWLKKVNRITDERPLVYMGLTPTIKYDI